MARTAIAVTVAFCLSLIAITSAAGAPPSKRPAATSGGLGKCTSISAQCAVEIGGQCNPKTGSWCYGFYRSRNCGGSGILAFDACLSRKLGERR